MGPGTRKKRDIRMRAAPTGARYGARTGDTQEKTG